MNPALSVVSNQRLDVARLQPSVTQARREAQQRGCETMTTQMRGLPHVHAIERSRSLVDGHTKLRTAPVALAVHTDPDRRLLDPPSFFRDATCADGFDHGREVDLGQGFQRRDLQSDDDIAIGAGQRHEDRGL